MFDRRRVVEALDCLQRDRNTSQLSMQDVSQGRGSWTA